MEQWDLYDQNRTPLGKTMQRGHPVPKGCFWVAVSIWTINKQGKILVTLRAQEKQSWPNYWENTGGAVLAGESSLQAAVREMQEETGICLQPHQLHFLGTDPWEQGFMDVYACCVDIPAQNIRLQPGETSAAKWVTWQQFEEMCRSQQVAQPIVDRFEAMKEPLQQFMKSCMAL